MSLDFWAWAIIIAIPIGLLLGTARTAYGDQSWGASLAAALRLYALVLLVVVVAGAAAVAIVWAVMQVTT